MHRISLGVKVKADIPVDTMLCEVLDAEANLPVLGDGVSARRPALNRKFFAHHEFHRGG
jgi:hypothetical protein